MSNVGPAPDVITATELVVEVQRLKQLICAQRRVEFDSFPEHAQESARPDLQEELPHYGDLETRSEQTVQYATGHTYTGDTLGSLKHGHGRLTCTNGDVYTGQWRYDKRDGTGHAVFERQKSITGSAQPKPICYEGGWSNDRTHGEGTCTYEDGAVYTGEWTQDQRSGWGKHVFPNRDWYEGEWEADTMQGQGRLTLTDRCFYECSWHVGQPQKGRWSSADERTEYEGQFKGMLWHGFGTVHQTGVRKYMGQWREGQEHGHGQCVTADGATYDGEWKLGSRCGKGKVSSKDGYQYSGEWLDDQPHGQGMCRMTDGSTYIGSWRAGKRHGPGRCLYASGDQYEGHWEEDVRDGQGGCFYASGDKYKGQWKGDKRHGQGICLFADGTRFRGEWEEDAWLQSAADPTLCKVSGPGMAKALAGQTASFVIQAYDELKNKRLSGGDDFRIHLLGPAGVVTHASLEDKEDGTYLVTYSCTAAGTHELHVTIGDEERVAESPYCVKVLPVQPVPRKCTVTGPGRVHSVAGEAAEFCIEGRDQFGNRCDGSLAKQLPVTIELSCKPFTCTVSVAPSDDGRYQCTYTPHRPGFYRLEVMSQGVHLLGSPFSVKVSEASATSATDNSKTQHLQQSSGEEDICRPLVDQVKVWEGIAAAEYGIDGSMDGWHNTQVQPGTSEEAYLQAHPDVPVVDNLEDIWLVSKLQEERKAKQKQQERAQQLQHYKQALKQRHATSNNSAHPKID